MNTIKTRLLAWWGRNVAKGYYKASSFITNAVAVAVGIVPDLINLALSSWSMIDSSLPTLSPTHKLYLFGAANVLAMFLRGMKQKSVEKASIEQAAASGKVVPLPASGVRPTPVVPPIQVE